MSPNIFFSPIEAEAGGIGIPSTRIWDHAGTGKFLVCRITRTFALYGQRDRAEIVRRTIEPCGEEIVEIGLGYKIYFRHGGEDHRRTTNPPCIRNYNCRLRVDGVIWDKTDPLYEETYRKIASIICDENDIEFWRDRNGTRELGNSLLEP